MTNPHRFSIGPDGQRLALARWGEDGSGKPPAFLLHGTGFVAEVWNDVAREPAADLIALVSIETRTFAGLNLAEKTLFRSTMSAILVVEV